MADFPTFFGVPPSPQNAFDLFKGEWSTRLPDACGWVASDGPLRACEDYRIEWLEKQIGSFSGLHVLELGPLEAGHTYMLHQRGAAEITAIEANPRAYLRCLIMKENFGLQRARFVLGDFLPYLRSNRAHFDLGLASGVLYHQHNPVELLELMAAHCDWLFLWTHYYEPRYMPPNVSRYFNPVPELASAGGYPHRLYRKYYGEALDWKGFTGGGAIDSCWLDRDDLLGALKHLGYEVRNIVEETAHPHGPAMLVAARRRA